MFTLLKRFIIKSSPESEEYRRFCGYLCGGVGIFLNTLLAAFKFLVGRLSGSISVTADAVNNLSDAASSVVTIMGFRLSGQKPDREHPYGHGRFEYIAGFVVSGLILLMGWSLIINSVKRIFTPVKAEFSDWMTVILAASILVKCYMALYNSKTGREINSVALKAAATDSLLDSISTFVVLAVTLLRHMAGIDLDGYAGAAVGLLISYTGIKSAMETLNPLLGRPPEEEYVSKLTEMALGFAPEILGVHDLMVHDYGPARRYVSFDVEVSHNIGIMELHEIIDALERKVESEMHCYATVHADPILNDDPEYIRARRAAATVINRLEVPLPETSERQGHFAEKKYSCWHGACVSMHDFHVVHGTSCTELVFDVVVPVDCPCGDTEIKEAIGKELLKKVGTGYRAVVTVDRTGIAG